jgi:C-terminal processing protease CtpA/Prc
LLHRTFQEIQRRRVQTLILDIRGNGGGTNSHVTDLYEYLAARPFLHIREAEIKATAVPYLLENADAVSLDTARFQRASAGTYDVRYRYPGATVRSPRLAFAGKVLLLTDGGTVSAGSELASLAYSQDRATLIGEETGGGYTGATGGLFLDLRLPASRLRLRIPTIRIRLGVDEQKVPHGHGVPPDFPVASSKTEFPKGPDPAMDLAFALVSKQFVRSSTPPRTVKER